MSAAEKLLTQWAEIEGVATAARVLSWDQETNMPPSGHASRGHAMSVLAGIHHDKLTDPALADAIDAADVEAKSTDDPLLADQVRSARADVTRATAIPGDLARRVAEVQSSALACWQQAKAADDFDAFAPMLATVVELTRETADALVAAGIADRRYDALLDEYEPGANEAQLVDLFDDLRSHIAPVVAAIADSGVVVDESPVRGAFPEDAQHAFGSFVAGTLGYDFDAGRLDTAAHPFTAGFDPGDVRITWRSDRDDLRPGLFCIMHETGHALYEQGLPAELARTPVGSAVSLGVHESQSRLWENRVGRSRPFWVWALPHLREHLPGTDGVTVEQIVRALNTVSPSLTRVEADQGTYDLHIAARFEIERHLIAGDIDVDELPGIWSDTYDDLLGIRPSAMYDGVLQDVHWAAGAFGYFPTYTIGNLVASQLFDAASDALDDLPGSIDVGDFAPLLGWLRENVHRHGRRQSADDLVTRATGRPLSSDAFVTHIRRTTADTYGITV
ncbi:MAG: carboxypeptidase M32 [Ilumatobacter sp.]